MVLAQVVGNPVISSERATRLDHALLIDHELWGSFWVFGGQNSDLDRKAFHPQEDVGNWPSLGGPLWMIAASCGVCRLHVAMRRKQVLPFLQPPLVIGLC